MKILTDIAQRLPRLSGGSSLFKSNAILKDLIEKDKNTELVGSYLVEKLDEIKSNVLSVSQPTLGRKEVQCSIVQKIEEFISARKEAQKNSETIKHIVSDIDIENNPELTDLQINVGDEIEFSKSEIVEEDSNEEIVDEKSETKDVEDTVTHIVSETDIKNNPELTDLQINVGDEIEFSKSEIVEEDSNEEIVDEKSETKDVKENTKEEGVVRQLGQKKNVTKTFITKNKKLVSSLNLTVDDVIYVDNEKLLLIAYHKKDSLLEHLDEPANFKK